MGKRWGTEAEETFMDTKVAGYRLAAAAKPKQIASYMASVWEEWFELFPEKSRPIFESIPPMAVFTADQNRILADAIQARKKKVHTWIRWRADHKIVRKSTSTQPSATPTALASLVQSAPRRRKPQLEETFSSIYYESKVKDRYTDAVTNVSDKSKRMKIRRMFIAEAMLDLTDEENNILKEAHIQACTTFDTDVLFAEAGGDTEGSGLSKSDKQKNIDSLGSVLERVLEELSTSTGWHFSVLMGGMDSGDTLRAASIHHGQTPAGNTFASSLPNFKEAVMTPYTEFLKRVFDSKGAEVSCRPPVNVTCAGGDTSATSATTTVQQPSGGPMNTLPNVETPTPSALETSPPPTVEPAASGLHENATQTTAGVGPTPGTNTDGVVQRVFGTSFNHGFNFPSLYPSASEVPLFAGPPPASIDPSTFDFSFVNDMSSDYPMGSSFTAGPSFTELLHSNNVAPPSFDNSASFATTFLPTSYVRSPPLPSTMPTITGVASKPVAPAPSTTLTAAPLIVATNAGSAVSVASDGHSSGKKKAVGGSKGGGKRGKGSVKSAATITEEMEIDVPTVPAPLAGKKRAAEVDENNIVQARRVRKPKIRDS